MCHLPFLAICHFWIKIVIGWSCMLWILFACMHMFNVVICFLWRHCNWLGFWLFEIKLPWNVIVSKISFIPVGMSMCLIQFNGSLMFCNSALWNMLVLFLDALLGENVWSHDQNLHTSYQWGRNMKMKRKSLSFSFLSKSGKCNVLQISYDESTLYCGNIMTPFCTVKTYILEFLFTM